VVVRHAIRIATAGLLLAIVFATAALGAPTIAEKRAEVRRIQAEMLRLDALAGAAAVAHNRALDRLDLAQARLKKTQEDLVDTRRYLKVSRAMLGRHVVAIYKNGRPSAAEILIAEGSINDTLAHIDLLDRASRFDARLVETMKERRAKLAELRVKQARERAAATDAKSKASARRRTVEGLVSRQRSVLASANADLKKLLAAERERLARLAAAKASAENRAPYRAGGESVSLPAGVSHVFPIRGASKFSDDWLFSRPGGRYHEGIDLFAAYGSPVVAVADGTLFRVGYNGLGGWRLWLRDNAGTTFYYAHLSSFAPAAKEGATVTGGTVIGFVGDSGDARGTSPHVHFEIHPGGGGPVRPYPLVSAWPRV
jgi:murein DD-endopeptidase MepM/ murein hydrolase activator NlpD